MTNREGKGGYKCIKSLSCFFFFLCLPVCFGEPFRPGGHSSVCLFVWARTNNRTYQRLSLRSRYGASSQFEDVCECAASNE